MRNKGNGLHNRRETQILPSDDHSSELSVLRYTVFKISENALVTKIMPIATIDAPMSCRYHIIKSYMRDSAIPSTSNTARKHNMFTSQQRCPHVLVNLSTKIDFCSCSFKTVQRANVGKQNSTDSFHRGHEKFT